ncbi:MAG: response regulator transcription factor [Verrucomicrobiia bacterium]
MSQGPPASAPAAPHGPPRRVFVVEDHPLMRRSLVEAIEREPDLAVCGQADDAPEMAAILSLQPDVVLTDVQLKSSSGLELIKALHTRAPELPVVATTMFDVRRTERLARAAGASGFISKENGPDQLVAVIREVLGKSGKHEPGA